VYNAPFHIPAISAPPSLPLIRVYQQTLVRCS